MANWNTLKTAVADIINTNGNQAITGQLLQNVLNNIITNVGENATFAGIANLDTNPGAPDGPVFYLTATAGTYPNFNGIEVQDGEAVILLWNNNAWSKKVTDFVTQEKLSELEENINQKLSELDSKVFNNSIAGDGTAYVRKTFDGLIPNNKYRITFDLSKWSYDSIPSDIGALLSMYSVKNDGTEDRIAYITKGDVPKLVTPYEFTLPSDSSGVLIIGGRAEAGSSINFVMSDITDIGNLQSDIVDLDYRFKNMVNIDGHIILQGVGTEIVSNILHLKKDRIYTVVPSVTDWNAPQRNDMKLALYAYTDGVESTIFRYVEGDDIPSSINVDTTNKEVDYYNFTWRGNEGVKMSVAFIENNPTLEHSLLGKINLKGAGSTFVKNYIKLDANKLYKIIPSVTNWSTEQTSTDSFVFAIYKVLKGVETRVLGYGKGASVPKNIFFDASQHKADYYILGWRGDEGVEMSVDFIDVFYKPLSKADFAIGSLSYSGYADYLTYDTIVCKGYYDISDVDKVCIKAAQGVKKRVSYFDDKFNFIKVTEWLDDVTFTKPNNAVYCKIGLRPYENGAVKHSKDNIIPIDLASSVESNLGNGTILNNIRDIDVDALKIGNNTPSVSKLTIVAKAEESASLTIKYYTRTKNYNFCSNCLIGNKRETINLMLPPIMYDGNAFEVAIEGKCHVELLNIEPINMQSVDTHIRVSAHLGYRLYFPENTKLAFKMAAMCGMWGSVVNPHETSDGGLICYHQNDARLSEDGVNVISLTPSEINSKTTEEMTSYNAGIYMSPYYTDENVPTFDEYCQIMAQGNMHPILSVNAITETSFGRIKEVLDKYGLTKKTIIRSYSTYYLEQAYSVFEDSVAYCFDAGSFTEDKISSWNNMDFGNAEKIVGFDWMHTATDEAIDEALNSVLSKGMRVIPDAKDNYELFKKLINKGVRDFTVNHFISANML